MVEVREQLFENPRGKVKFSLPAPGVFHGTISGHYSIDLLGPYVESMAAALGQRRPMVGFHNWLEMTSYDPKCRIAMTEWVKTHREQCERQHILLRSKLVAMGVATASLLIGGDQIASYTNRVTFDVALRAALRGQKPG